MTPGRPYSYSPLPGRARLEWPEGQRLAVYVCVNVEYYESGKPAISLFPGTASFTPDPLNEGWRDYGPRVGIWRMLEMFDRLGVPVTAALNSDVCDEYPAIIEAGVERAWAWIAHGKNNSTWQVGMGEDEERTYLEQVVSTIESATGKRPQGWLGPALTETSATLRLLGELGLTYVLDWAHDDQPAPLDRDSGGLITLPYASELNDIPAFVLQGMTGESFGCAIVDAFDVLYAESERTGLVMSIGLHPFLVGQPHRIRHLERALEHVAGHAGVWMTTADEIAASYLEHAA